MSELIREAMRDGRRVALLRCYDDGGTAVVEAQITPHHANSISVARGPYRFTTAADAFRFVQEALLALQYLGCTVT
ncbi:MAG TPA: hypothetical protein VIJ70_01110 [Gaiellaceae bacterium]